MFGFDQAAVTRRLRLFDLEEIQSETVDLVHKFVIEPNVQKIIDGFYEYLLTHAEYSNYISNQDVVSRLVITQQNYVSGLGKNYNSLKYFEDRLRVGLAHHRIGMSLCLYQTSYYRMQEIILDMIPKELEEHIARDMRKFVLRVIGLDMSIAIDSYHFTSLKSLQDSIVDLEHKEKKLKELVERDPLTKIQNRSGILGQLAKLIDKMDNRLPLSIIMVDLDNLNQINDTYGHLAGDHVIKGAISRLATVLQGYPFGRYGGDEFMILLPKFNGEDALKFAEKIKVVMAEKPFELGKRSISLTISQGVTEISYNEKVVKAIQRVDSALIEAKKKGGGVIVYRPLSED